MGMTTMNMVHDNTTGFATGEAIAATLRLYIDGAREGDSGLIRRAFTDGANIRGSYGGKPVDWTLQAFCEVIEKGGGAPDLRAQIVAIEFAGSAAMARLEAENWRGTRYTDFFVLIMRDTVWRISSKVFFAHAQA
jgi:hypothetical protein